jgi:O-succinylbenzoic acid--CoA ligase
MSIPRWSERAVLAPDAPALVTALRTWSNREVGREVQARAARIAHLPLVALVGATTVAHVLDVYAAIEARVPFVVLHPRWTERETAAILDRAQPAAVLDGGALGARDARTPSRSLDGLLAVVATSGTTGVPKLAMLSRTAFAASAEASAAHLGAGPTDRWLLSMPLAHVGGLGVVIRSLVYGTPLVVHEGALDALAWLTLAHNARVTHVSLVPTGLARVLEHGKHALPRSLRAILLGGAACPRSILERAIDARLPVHPTYGLTETCGQVATTRTPIADPDEAFALEPLPGVALRVVDGILRVRSPASMRGWLDAPDPFDTDGYYDTGDLGELDPRGRLRIHARRTDLIVSGGENVYPREVEDALERVDGVRAACVFGVPDVVWGQRVAVALVTDATAPSDDEILARARAELAGFKLPRLVARLDALSVGETGKIDRARTAARALPLLRAL